MGKDAWKNWAGNLHLDPVETERPGSFDELVDVVKRASAADRKIRVVGGGHSWSPLVGDESLYEGRRAERELLMLIDMSGLDRVLNDGGLVDENSNPPTITVECGMTIERLECELQTQLSGRRYTLISPTLFSKPTIGGVISTGSHGTGRERGCFADSVCALTFITDGGWVRKIREGEEGFEAARVALGTFGVLYSATIRVARDFNVHTDRRYVAFHHTFGQFEDLAASATYLEIFYWPLQNRLWLYVMNDTQSKPDKSTFFSRLGEDFGTKLQNTLGGTILPWIASRRPGLTPLLCKVSGRLILKVDASVKSASEAFHFQKAYPFAWDMSYGVPMAETGEAWGRAIRLIDRYADSKLYPINLVLHCRFIRGGNGWLAPNYGEDRCLIEVATSLGTPDRLWREFFETLETHWFDISRARPHWAKLTNKIEMAGERYPRILDFMAERQRWDPKGRFMNPFLERLFSPGPSSQSPSRPWRPFHNNLL